jgi:WD40 repeat protein
MVGHTGTVTSAGFSPDGKMLVTGGADRTARVWDVSSGRAITVPVGFTQPISVALFAKENEVWLRDASGEWFARRASDGSALPAPTMEALTSAEVNSNNTASVRVASRGASFETPALPAAINRTAFDDSQSRVALAVADGTVRLYPVNVFDVISATEGKLERQLTCEERVRFLNESTDCVAIPTPTPEK